MIRVKTPQFEIEVDGGFDQVAAVLLVLGAIPGMTAAEVSAATADLNATADALTRTTAPSPGSSPDRQ